MKKITIRTGTGTGKQTTMVYKHPGTKLVLKEGSFDYKRVPSKEVEKALEDGWYLTSPEALENSTGPEVKPSVSKDEVAKIGKKLEEKSAELETGLKTLEVKQAELDKREKEFDEKQKKRTEFDQKKNKKG